MIDVFNSRIACNSYILYNDKKEGILVDPGYNFNNCLINHIIKINIKIKAILITHGHYDHISALEDIISAFPDAITYINEDELDFLTEPKLNLSYADSTWLNKKVIFKPKKLILLNDGEEFDECGFTIKIIHTPFHTKGSSCYYIAKEKILFSGDSLFYSTIGRTDLPTGSEKTIENSLLKLKKLPEGILVYPGHSAITKLDREKKYNAYLRNI